jgi:SlyX protein
MTNTTTAAPESIEQRLTDLEIKTSLADDMLDQLNQTIFRQQQMIDALAREVHSLRQQLPQDRSSGQNLRDELPPHY